MNDERLKELKAILNSYSTTLDHSLQEEIFEAIADKTTPHTLKTKAMLFLRKHKGEIDIKLFCAITKIDEEIAYEFIENEIIEAYFPIANENVAKLSTLYVIKTQAQCSTAFKSNINSLLSIVKNLTYKNFFVMFEDEFSGNSFMLALVASLVAKNPYVLQNYSFSGVFDSAGNILRVDFIKEKEIVSKENKKRFIDNEIVSNLKELLYILNDTKVDLPFCIATKPSTVQKTPKDAALYNLKMVKKAIESKRNIKINAIKKLYNLTDEDFIFYTDKDFIEEKDWKRYIRKAHDKIRLLKSKIDDKIAVLHFSFLSPSTFSFCIGALLGCKDPFVAYHYSAGKYHAVLDYRNKDPRNLKEIPENTKHIKCIYDGQSNPVLAIVFYLASHNPIGDVRQYLDSHYHEYDMMQCVLSHKQGRIPLKDWSIYIKEMYKRYNDTKSNKVKKRLFFFSSPVPLSFGLGLDIETFEDVEIFNLENTDDKYIKILNLKELRM